jgi:hypothetical protein
VKGASAGKTRVYMGPKTHGNQIGFGNRTRGFFKPDDVILQDIPNTHFDLVKRVGRINHEVAVQGVTVGGYSKGGVESKFIGREVVVIDSLSFLIGKHYGGLIKLIFCENDGNNTRSVAAVFVDVEFDDGMVCEDTVVKGEGRIVFEGSGSGGRE